VTDDQKFEEMIRQKERAPINMHASPVAKVSRIVTDERFDPR